MAIEVQESVTESGDEWAKECENITIYSLMPDSYGEPSQCIPDSEERHGVRSKLALRQPNGTPVWTLKDPGVRPKLGNTLCMLHPDHKNRQRYDSMGLGICMNGHIKNEEYELELHMKTKHPKEWATIQRAEEKDKERRREAREDAMLAAMQASVAPPVVVSDEEPWGGELYVSDKDRAAMAESVSVSEVDTEVQDSDT